MKTYRFENREGVLREIFDKKNIAKIWRKTVKNQLRSLDIKDIYDYYDFNYAIEDRATAIRSEILRGAYKAQSPLFFKIEKKLGICRHLMILQPTDAIVVQVITDAIYDDIKEHQPSPNAFYSRDKHFVGKPYEVSSSDYESDWRQKWKLMQKKIYNFNQEKELIIVTDLTNYFDSIDLATLREVVLSLVGIRYEVLIDLMFRIIEETSWKPDYLPYRKHGLPTVNIESIRLLGHAFLFEIDEVLMKKTSNNFTRWMDDITIGVDTRKEAIQVLSGVSDVLKSRGLALNLSKTNLYTASEFKDQFLIEMNQYLDSVEVIERFTDEDRDFLLEKFKNHLKERQFQYWGKVTKRFITSFGRRKIDILKNVEELYLENPSLRLNLARYLSNIGYSAQSAQCVLSILSNLNIYDDVSLFFLSKVLTDWDIPIEDASFIKQISSKIVKLKEPLQFYCLVWIKAKYDNPKDLLDFIEKYKNNWKKSSFLCRQIMGVLSRLYPHGEERVKKLLNDQIQSGIQDSVSIASHIVSFISSEELSSRTAFYVFPNKLGHYSLERFLVLCSVLNSEKVRGNKNIQRKIKESVKDRHFRKWLEVTYNIS